MVEKLRFSNVLKLEYSKRFTKTQLLKYSNDAISMLNLNLYHNAIYNYLRLTYSNDYSKIHIFLM